MAVAMRGMHAPDHGGSGCSDLPGWGQSMTGEPSKATNRVPARRRNAIVASTPSHGPRPYQIWLRVALPRTQAAK